MTTTPKDRTKSRLDVIEESVIAFLLGIMTIITFANVIARYIFNSNILWALEATVFLFAWLVLLGISHGVRKNAHLGVDAVLNILPTGARRVCILLSVVVCIAFSLLMVYGAFEYWWPFATKQAFYETNDIPFPGFLAFLEGWINGGEAYEKLPRVIPYAALPIGMVLMAASFIYAGWQVFTGRRDLLIASHEAEDMVEDAARARAARGDED